MTTHWKSIAALCLSSALVTPAFADARDDDIDRSQLPISAGPSRAVLTPDLASSVPDYPQFPKAPAGAPNVILIMTDDAGFGSASAFGGPVPTPNLERLARSGIRYTQFHTTGMCSPSRAALLTGRNSHAVGAGTLTDFAGGFPGYNGIIPKSAATIAEILKGNGYSTAMFGKHHNIPMGQNSRAGPFDQWPLGLGFEHFFGFIGSGTDQWRPRLYRDNSPVRAPASGEVLDKRLADEAIDWMHAQKAARPDKPFFIYYATGSTHTPIQAPEAWIARFKGEFDEGWDKLREQTLARQIAMGVAPKGTKLAPWQKDIPRWRSLSPDERKVHARFMEAFAGMMAFQDHQLGRILDEVERMGLRDNTLIIFIEGDNGSDAAGSPEGNLTEVGEMANRPSTLAEKLGELDKMGGPHMQALYATGWAQALDAPFPYYKQIASHLGGTRNGMVVSWPSVITGRGVRTQYHHVIDVAPTILKAARVPAPAAVNGVQQQPIDGLAMDYSFNDPKATSRRGTQYYEILGNRAIYHDGWLANTTPLREPWNMVFSRDAGKDLSSQYKWELYDLRNDFSQSTDLSAKYPDRLIEMQSLFDAEARRYKVYPIDDRTAFNRTEGMVANYTSPRSRYVIYGKNISLSRDHWPPITNRGFRLEAEVTPAGERDSGVIASVGSWFGGWSFYLKDGVPTLTHVFTQLPGGQTTLSGSQSLPAGRRSKLQYAFTYDGGGPGKGGNVTISVDGKQVASARLARSLVNPVSLDEKFDTGFDGEVPVTDSLPGDGAFPGEIGKIAVTVGPIFEAGIPDAAAE